MFKSYLLILVALCAALVLAVPVPNTRSTTASALSRRAEHSHDGGSYSRDRGSHGHDGGRHSDDGDRHSNDDGDRHNSDDGDRHNSDDSSSSSDDSSSSSDDRHSGDDSSSSSDDSSSSSNDSSSSRDDSSSSNDDSSSSNDDSSSSNDDSSSSDSGSSGGSQFQGRGTWFSDTTGSCEVKFDQSDMIVALNEEQMGSLQGSGSQCGKMIRVSYGGKSVDVKVVDTCPSQYCDKGALDLSQAAFKELAGGLSKGVLDLNWEFI